MMACFTLDSISSLVSSTARFQLVVYALFFIRTQFIGKWKSSARLLKKLRKFSNEFLRRKKVGML